MSHELDLHCEDPWVIFQNWYRHASGKVPNNLRDRIFYPFRHLMRKIYPPFSLHGGDAMVLASSSLQGHPSARVVLFKELWDGGVVFYTNYNSRKAQELIANPYASLVFHWALPERQVRIEGIVEKVPVEMSESYWRSRPRESQIGAWASSQSEAIESREELLGKVEEVRLKFKAQSVPRPSHWGGFVLRASQIEFWEACVARLHRRRRYEKIKGQWRSSLLSP